MEPSRKRRIVVSDSAAALCDHWFTAVSPTFGAFDDFIYASTEYPVTAHNRFVSGFQEVDETGFHPYRTRSGNGKGEFVLGLEGIAQKVLDLFRQIGKEGIKVIKVGRDKASSTRGGAFEGPGPSKCGSVDERSGKTSTYFFLVNRL